jgi:hypothetical protein
MATEPGWIAARSKPVAIPQRALFPDCPGTGGLLDGRLNPCNICVRFAAIGGEAVIDDAIDVADGVSAAFTVVDWFWLAVWCGLIVYFVAIAARLKIDKSGPTDVPSRVLCDQEIEDLENRGGIW